MEKKEFTISIFTENLPGLLQRVVGNFTKRHINIISLTTSQSSVSDIHRFTIVVNIEEEKIEKLVTALERSVDVLKAFYYHPNEIVYQEIALFKVPAYKFNESNQVENMIRKHNAHILTLDPDFVIIEKTGHEPEIDALLVDLKKIGVYEFVRSGRVAVTKHMEPLNNYLESIQKIEIN
ncbi:acetolactate synthase small subunit [Membranihabitans maritimus]|uniref:acetolactate synthase small subunit n=1 Tax=Membranihabitans maritimus TaxID=2904244 RepID=UPI001F00CCFB|nr:acetolactate synthase small subunit [Membranihabitans maritimus]